MNVSVYERSFDVDAIATMRCVGLSASLDCDPFNSFLLNNEGRKRFIYITVSLPFFFFFTSLLFFFSFENYKKSVLVFTFWCTYKMLSCVESPNRISAFFLLASTFNFSSGFGFERNSWNWIRTVESSAKSVFTCILLS